MLLRFGDQGYKPLCEEPDCVLQLATSEMTPYTPLIAKWHGHARPIRKWK